MVWDQWWSSVSLSLSLKLFLLCSGSFSIVCRGSYLPQLLVHTCLSPLSYFLLLFMLSLFLTKSFPSLCTLSFSFFLFYPYSSVIVFKATWLSKAGPCQDHPKLHNFPLSVSPPPHRPLFQISVILRKNIMYGQRPIHRWKGKSFWRRYRFCEFSNTNWLRAKRIRAWLKHSAQLAASIKVTTVYLLDNYLEQCGRTQKTGNLTIW